jgi:hypothetical protein
MNTFDRGFAQGWRQREEHQMDELQRRAELQRPFVPEPATIAPTRVRVLRAFFVGGKRVERGSVVTIDAFTAHSLAASGRAEII